MFHSYYVVQVDIREHRNKGRCPTHINYVVFQQPYFMSLIIITSVYN